MLALELEEVAKAIKFEMIGQTFAVVGMAVAKLSMGFFQLEIVVKSWHKNIIRCTMGALLGVSVLTAIMFWVQCLPSKGIWDPRERPNSKCNINITPFAIVLGGKLNLISAGFIYSKANLSSLVSCALADFFFAIFPWFYIWKLQMPPKNKIMVCGSMSLGLLSVSYSSSLDFN